MIIRCLIECLKEKNVFVSVKIKYNFKEGYNGEKYVKLIENWVKRLRIRILENLGVLLDFENENVYYFEK